MASSQRSDARPVTLAIAATAAIILVAYGVVSCRQRESRALIGLLLTRPTSETVSGWARQDGARVRHTAATPMREEELDVCLRQKATFLIWFGADGRAQNWARAVNSDSSCD